MKDALKIRLAFLLLFFSVQLGCPSERESLHELDHQQPAHWPKGLRAAARGIEQRTDNLQSGAADPQTLEELIDLVEWVPEIAADTDLSEQRWQPIYDLSERLRGQLRKANFDISSSESELRQLVQLLRAAHQELPPDEIQTID